MNNNYLDIEANGNVVKKSIEEICHNISQNVLENNGKFFKLKVDTENTYENELDAVSIILENPEKQKIEGEQGKILIADGVDWTTSSELYTFKQDLLDEDNNFLGLNYVIGPDFTEITDNAKFTLTGNPKDIEDKESFNFSLADKANCSISGNHLMSLDGTTRFTMHDTAKMDITQSSQVYVHDGTQIHIDGGELHSGSDIKIHNGAIHIQDGSLPSEITETKILTYTLYYNDIGGKPARDWTRNEIIYNGHTVVDGSVSALENLGFTLSKSELKVLDDSYQLIDTYIRISWYKYSGKKALGGPSKAGIYIHEKAQIQMSEGSVFCGKDRGLLLVEGDAAVVSKERGKIWADGKGTVHVQDSSGLFLDGNSQILFTNVEDVGTKTGRDPYLHAAPSTLMFIGKGSYGVGVSSSEKSEIPNTASSPDSDFAPRDIDPLNCNPRFLIQNENLIVIDGEEEKGSNYIRISGCDTGTGLETNQNQIHILGNTFFQLTSNAHQEVHDNSRIIMRGTLKDDVLPWNDGRNLKDYTRGNNQLGDWRRPILPDNSPVWGMYDVSQFCMRGIWNDYLIRSYTSTISFDSPITTNIPSTIAEMTEQEKELFISALQTKISTNIFDTKDCSEVNWQGVPYTTEITGVALEGGGYTLTVKNCDYFQRYDKPEDWTEYIPKIENQPLLEVIENSEIRFYGNSKLKLKDYTIEANPQDGITFSDGTDSVSFTISELKQLKTLL